ncbi:MAG: hypothetical protein QHH09_00240 [Microgenomates group bacterium]|nr:hypothetical protein [Microgenomates group bacterium]
MGKIRTRILGLEEVEEKQKKEQKERAQEKKLKKSKTRIKAVEVEEKAMEKMEKAKKIIAETPAKTKEIKARKAISKGPSRGKKYQEIKKKIDKNKKYSLKEAIDFLKKNRTAKFDESVEIHLNVDQVGLKGEVELAKPTGKTLRIKIVDDKVLSDIEKGKIDFDLLITHPSYMPKLAKFAKVLGPKGLMPNPKAGTISPHPEAVLKKFSSGVLRWKTESKFPLIHQMIGKISFDEKDLVKNIELFIKSVGKSHIQAAFVKSTMSPSLKLDIEKF